MSLIAQFVDAANQAIRTGNLEADPAQKESFRAWQEACAAQDGLVADLVDQIRAEARAAGPADRQRLLKDLNREVARMGEGCPILTL